MSCSKTNNQTGKLIRKISSKLCLQFCSFQQRKFLNFNNVYRCYAKSTWNCKNIVKSSKKIEVNFWPRPAHKMTPIVLWPIYSKLLLQCTKIQSIGKAVKIPGSGILCYLLLFQWYQRHYQRQSSHSRTQIHFTRSRVSMDLEPSRWPRLGPLEWRSQFSPFRMDLHRPSGFDQQRGRVQVGFDESGQGIFVASFVSDVWTSFDRFSTATQLY